MNTLITFPYFSVLPDVIFREWQNGLCTQDAGCGMNLIFLESWLLFFNYFLFFIIVTLGLMFKWIWLPAIEVEQHVPNPGTLTIPTVAKKNTNCSIAQ